MIFAIDMRASTDRPASAGAQKHRKPAILAALALLPALAWAQTAPLNDTGQTLCYSAANASGACDEATTGHTGARPGQDGRFGRDAAQATGVLPAKTGGGEAGFDFTALNASGDATTPGTHACVKDNVTGLTWEVKQTGNGTQPRYAGHLYTWYDSSADNPGSQGNNSCNGTLPGNQCNTQAYVAAVNAAGLCGKSDWRMPTRRELLSLVHNGLTDAPAIDRQYFPDVGSTWGNWYWWTSDTYAPSPAFAWFVYFDYGVVGYDVKTYTNAVRLVRSGE